MGIFKEEPKQAVRPNSFFSVPAFVTNEEAKKEGLTDEERILAAGAATEFWRTLKSYINEVTAQLDQVNEAAIASGESLDKIGQNTVVLSITKGVLRQIFEKVQDAKDAMEAAHERGEQ